MRMESWQFQASSGKTLNAQSVSLSDLALRAVCHCSAIPKGIRARMWSRLREPDRTPGRQFSVPFFGCTYQGSLDCYVDSQVFFFGAYEPEELELLHNILSTMDSPVVVDVGANVGHHSLFLSNFAGIVHSFEPWYKVRKHLVRHLDENGISNVQVHDVALGAKDERRVYYAPEGGNTGTGSFLSTHATDRNRPSEELEIVDGDAYFQEHGIKNVDLLKIDVEGWEWFVLSGLEDTIRRCRPFVVFEYSESTKQFLHGRSELNCFQDYKVFEVGKKTKAIAGESLPVGNLMLVPRKKSEC